MKRNNEILIIIPTAAHPTSYVIQIFKDENGDYVMASSKLKESAMGETINGDLRDPSYLDKYFDGYDVCALNHYFLLIEEIDRFFQEHVVWRDITSGP